MFDMNALISWRVAPWPVPTYSPVAAGPAAALRDAGADARRGRAPRRAAGSRRRSGRPGRPARGTAATTAHAQANASESSIIHSAPPAIQRGRLCADY